MQAAAGILHLVLIHTDLEGKDAFKLPEILFKGKLACWDISSSHSGEEFDFLLGLHL